MTKDIGFEFKGDDDDYIEYKYHLQKQGKSVQQHLSSIINQEIDIIKGMEKKDLATASAHQDKLRDYLLTKDLSRVLIDGHYHVKLDQPEHIEFIQAAKHELGDRVKGAVTGAIYQYWIKKWAVAKGKQENQADVYYCEHKGAKKFNEYLERINVTFSCDILPKITLSDLTEKDLGRIIQLDAVVIGPSPKKLETESGRYIQKVLLQEPEDQARDNNPVVIKSVFHGGDTMNVASGQSKRIIGQYTVQQPVNGEKIQAEKTLIIDVINARTLEEKEETILSAKELVTAKEFAENEPDNYLTQLINSFCPKIYGRKLEKQALLLSLLGGSEFVGYRSQSHTMLIGEADSGKSELVKFADKIAQKSSIIDGSNATGVGVLFALDEYDGTKILRSGAMILNNGGHIIVDEYDKMPKQEQKKFNQAMEQQRATYNKGGHSANAECKTTVIAACNPKNERWVQGDIMDNMPFDPSTITRFDLIIKTEKETHENEIRAKMRHIMKGKRGELEQVADPMYVKGLLNHLRKLKPIISPEAEELLINKFVEFTQIDQPGDAIPIQTRQIEGIQRLCEAYAKLLFKKEVDCEIVEQVIKFYQQCLATLGMNVEKGVAQFDLSGKAVNRDKFFEDTFKALASEDENGFVYLHQLGEKLMESDKFNNVNMTETYIEKRKKMGWLFEPKPGVLKRQ